ncbi:hypothetical protein TNCV_4035251 [Trichonephila clavipes]|nr:hypothetical protein TNCV_4035251 [Trichonephila clavipes]
MLIQPASSQPGLVRGTLLKNSFTVRITEQHKPMEVITQQLYTPNRIDAECLDPIDLENGALLDSQLSASSSYNSAFTPENARLGSDSVWMSAFVNDDQYLQVNASL